MEKKLVDIQNGGPGLFDEMSSEKCITMKISWPSLQGSESLEITVICKERSFFFEGEQSNKDGSSVRVEVSDVLRGDGDRQQVSPEVIRKNVSKGTQHAMRVALVGQPRARRSVYQI